MRRNPLAMCIRQAVWLMVVWAAACGNDAPVASAPPQLVTLKCENWLAVSDYRELCPTLNTVRPSDLVSFAEALEYSKTSDKAVFATEGGTCQIGLRRSGAEPGDDAAWATLGVRRYVSVDDARAAVRQRTVSPFWLRALGDHASARIVDFVDQTEVRYGPYVIAYRDQWRGSDGDLAGELPDDYDYCTPEERPKLLLRLVERLGEPN